MFTDPYLSGELAWQQRRDMLAQADRRRPARRLHATSGPAPARQRLRGVLRAAARLRPAPGT